VVGRRGTAAGAASGDDGRWLMVREGGTRRRGARGATGSSEGDRGGATQWLNGGGTRRRSGGDGQEEERLFTGGGAPFIAGRGGGWRRRGGESGGGETAAGKQRRRQCRCSDTLPAVCVSGRQLSGRWARAVLTGWAGTVDMGWVQSGAQHFSNYSNFAPILKYKTKTILMSINVQTWHGAMVDYSKKLLPLGPLPIPN
jgi:hypothetical protein